MGREIKRVPLDFAHPLNEVWPGFVNPHYAKCAACGGSGETPDLAWLSNITHMLLIAGGDGLRGQLHPWLQNMPLRPDRPPTPAMAELTGGLAGRSPEGRMGHDACDRWSATKKIIKAAGLPAKWGVCKPCKGSGIDPAKRRAHDRWKEKEPPTGEGWQVWETVSEGSPVSPVFPTREALVDWLVSQGYSLAGADAFTQSGWAPSMVMSGGKMYRDIESVVLQK